MTLELLCAACFIALIVAAVAHKVKRIHDKHENDEMKRHLSE